MKALRAWAKLEKRLKALGLGWAFHRLPPTLQVARTPEFPLGVDCERLLPEAYRAFVADVGYPVVGFRYHCATGLSFLPPGHLETCSAMVGELSGRLRPSKKKRPQATAAFFAGIELSDLVGWAFAPRPGGEEPCVWAVDGAPTEPLGDFDTWATERAERIEGWAGSLSTLARKQLQVENDGEDPHRALDYALDRSEPHQKATAKDRALHWVCDETKSPYRYSVIDDQGTWHLRPGKPFDSVGPFVRGTARVEVGDRVLRVDSHGKVVKDLTPKPVAAAAPTVDLTGKRVTWLGSFNVLNVSQAEFTDRVTELGGKMVYAHEEADIYALSSRGLDHFPENVDAAKARQAKVPSTQLVPLAKFAKQLGLGS